MEIEIVPLTPQRADLFMDLFDGEGFADNPEWASCYCRYYHFDHAAGDWEKEKAATNRAISCDLIEKRAMRGWLALADGRPVGWLNAGRKDSYCALSAAPGMAGAQTGMITCFLVAPSARGQGVARRLLGAALAQFRKDGLSWAEAKPAKDPKSAASNYHGPLKLYLDNGFEMVGDFSPYQHLVRVAL